MEQFTKEQKELTLSDVTLYKISQMSVAKICPYLCSYFIFENIFPLQLDVVMCLSIAQWNMSVIVHATSRHGSQNPLVDHLLSFFSMCWLKGKDP